MFGKQRGAPYDRFLKMQAGRSPDRKIVPIQQKGIAVPGGPRNAVLPRPAGTTVVQDRFHKRNAGQRPQWHGG